MSASPLRHGADEALAPLPVSAELEQIFLTATGVPSARVALDSPRAEMMGAAPAAPTRRWPSGSVLGGAAAIALAGASAFAIAYTAPEPARAPSMSAPTASVAQTDAMRAPVTPPLQAVSSLPTIAVEPAAVPMPRRLARAAASPHLAHRAPIVRHRPWPPQNLVLADRQLRRAYARATSAGVPTAILVDYRNRWEDLRHEANWRPARVAGDYRAMAVDLTRMSQSPRGPARRRTPTHVRTW